MTAEEVHPLMMMMINTHHDQMPKDEWLAATIAIRVLISQVSWYKVK